MTDLELHEGEEEEDSLPSPIEAQQEADEEMHEISERVSRLGSELAEMASTPLEDDRSQALVTRDATPGAKKRELGVMRAKAAKRATEIESKREEIRQASQEMERAIKKQMELAMAALAPLQKHIARLEEGIWMVNLYLGRDEEILSLRDGEPAPAETPVTIRQLVLYMDEECAINPDNDGIDATEIDLFDEWLQADPRHVDQVLPEQKGVVALRPRRTGKNYSDPWKKMALDEANRKTYFLIRNGDKLWRTWTEFNVGERLVPLADEFGSFFYETHRSYAHGQRDHKIPIEPGTPAWERAEEAADARQRHYMRVGLILQGLVDRTTVFHPLPEGGINFMDFEHSGRSWRFLIDAENLIDTGRLPYREWIAERAELLQVGMRIIGSFNRWEDRERYEHHINPRGAEKPPTGELLLLEDKGAYSGDFVVRYKRTEKIWTKRWIEDPERPGWGHYGGQVEPKRRASCVISASDRNIIPFDLVTEEEMLVYLNARLDRHAYSEMFPLLKAAIRAKRAEREEEQPFRTMMVGVLARDNKVTAEEADAAVDELIFWWKTGNRWHRPLVGDEESQAKAVRMIVTEHARRLKAAGRDVKSSVIETIRRGSPDLIAILRRRSTGNFLAISPEQAEVYENVDYVSPYVRIDEYTSTGRPKGEPKRWFMLTPSWLSKLDVVLGGETWDGWPKNASTREHLTGPELETLAQRIIRGTGLEAAAYDPHKRRFYTWTWKSDAVVDISSPFTSKLKGPEVQERSRRWTRKGSEPPALGDDWSSQRPNYTYQKLPWDTRPLSQEKLRAHSLYWDDKEVEPEELAVNKYVVLFVDEEIVERYESEKQRYKEASEKVETPLQLARAHIKSIEKAWVARKEQAEYERFLEDYLDPDLWEGHKKSLPKDAFNYPFSHYRSWRGEPDALALMVEYHVEKEIPIVGLTVWEATENFPPMAWIKTRLKKSDDWWGSAPEAIDIPEEIRDLRFAAPEAEEDDDDGDA